MNANELRIGNIVEYYVDDYFNTNEPEIGGWIETTIDPEDLLHLSSEDDDDYRPIPLTPGWLERFGFKKRVTVGHSTQWFIGLNPINHDWLFDVLWLDNEPAPFYRNGYFMIKHVHQLQNLYFALTGEELKP